jgi:hypothetical protein
LKPPDGYSWRKDDAHFTPRHGLAVKSFLLIDDKERYED